LVSFAGTKLLDLVYGDSSTLWRINLGWRRRQKKDQTGYVLDVERGYWAKSQATETDPDDPMSARLTRVVPYVEDRRNCLLVTPATSQSREQMASLQAALKAAIQVQYQLEDSELAAEPLPNDAERRALLFYEASEGGAGVLRHLVDEGGALATVARLALDLAHFDPDTGQDLGNAPRAKERCEAACYDCLLSYYNQRDHRLLDRHLLPALLLPWLDSRLECSPTSASRSEQLEALLRLCGSELERRWLRMVDELELRLPTKGQELVVSCSARPDFSYPQAWIFVDGPPHDEPRQQAEDLRQQERLEDLRMVIRFHHAADWLAIFRRYPSVFGELPKERV